MSSARLPLSVVARRDELRSTILDWFGIHGRILPWRTPLADPETADGDVSRDPWTILVSEVMLQQTQASRVAAKLPPFLNTFPSVESLARGDRADVIRAWQGLGYNRRVLRLQEAARHVVDRHGGIVPSDIKALKRLPGVGEYTARAIACFAFGKETVPVDVNILRVLSRLVYGAIGADHRSPSASIDIVAQFLAPPGRSDAWTHALMDLGATVCTARRPRCSECPVCHLCLGAHPYTVRFHVRRPASTEPTLYGQPRRIWRGRIVELLRAAPTGLSSIEMAHVLFDHVNAEEAHSIEAVCTMVDALWKEGFIEPVDCEAGGGGEVTGAAVVRLASDVKRVLPSDRNGCAV